MIYNYIHIIIILNDIRIALSTVRHIPSVRCNYFLTLARGWLTLLDIPNKIRIKHILKNFFLWKILNICESRENGIMIPIHHH